MLTKTDSISSTTVQSVIGSSQMGAALGISRMSSRAKLWRELTGNQTPSELKPNKILEELWTMGNANEHLCVRDLEIASGILFDHTGEKQLTGFSGRIRSTPDGIYGLSGCEAKCMSSKYGKWIEPKPSHIAQCQTHMYVHDLEEVVFGRWEFHTKTMVWMIFRDEEYIQWMIEEADKFLKLVDDRTPPPRRNKRPIAPGCRIERIQ